MKVGDKVVCISIDEKSNGISYNDGDPYCDRYVFLTKNKVYNIVFLGESVFCEYICIINDNNVFGIYSIRRFDLLKDIRREKLLKLNECRL